ncbi:hypothetical protein V1264_009607 [Littorina saxatilis]|uniref:Protein unc-45 homolog B n=1 Tax=Littorina saxatilis TaxID=31220 RepID=A0AAN9G1P3_9CAEN
MGESHTLKEEGNNHFKTGQYKEALKCYKQALGDASITDNEKAVIYKNRAACYLKLNDNQAAVDDCTASLLLVENDPKALFRRCQAYDALGKVEEAYKDVMTLMKVDPKNTAIVPYYQKLHPIIQEKAKQQNSLPSKVSQMFNLAFDPSVELDKRTQAFNNLIVLSRDDAGANLICQQGGMEHLLEAMKEKQEDVIIGALRVLASLARNSKKRATAVASALDLNILISVHGQGTKEVTSAAGHLLQMLLDWYAGLQDYRAGVKHVEEEKKKGERVRWPKLQIDEDEQKFVDQVFSVLIKVFDSSKVTPEARDSAMQLVMKNVTYKTGLSWSGKFLDTDGIERLLTVAGTQKLYKTLTITDMSRMHASAALSTIYEDLVSDKQRDKFKDKCCNFLKDLFGDKNVDSKIEAIEIISSLLQGPYDVGTMLLGMEGVVQIMLTMAASDNTHYQRVAVEAIVHSASKKDRCTGILKDAVPILKKLYQSADDSLKVRALVGLCKLGSFSGGDVSEQPMADGSTLYLSKICRKFLANTTKDCDLRKWATEGLAYLTLDAEVKEELVEDTTALQSIFELAKMPERNMTYACVTVLVNLTNSYDTADITPEMAELARFAKQHVPEEHEKDKHEWVIERILKLAKAGMVNALVALSSTESKNSRECLCRIFMAMATVDSLRGLLVQQGAVKALLQLVENNTDNGSVLAAHALAKIAVTLDPATAFPGQRVYEVVRPLISLLHNDRSGLQNFEALLSLTNLASTHESVRQRILSDSGLSAIERCMFEDHEMIRRAATECMCNMLMSEKVQEMFAGDNDRVKMLVLYAAEEDFHLVRAATGGLAFISANHKLCDKITQVNQWLDIIQQILVTENTEIQHRACHLVMNLMADSKDIATKLVQSQVLEILMAITKLEGPQYVEIRKCAQAALDLAKDHGLIKPFGAQACSLEQLREALQVKPLTITEIDENEEEGDDEDADKETSEEQTKKAYSAEEEEDEEFREEMGLTDDKEETSDVSDRLKGESEDGREGGEDGREGGEDGREGGEGSAAEVKAGEEKAAEPQKDSSSSSSVGKESGSEPAKEDSKPSENAAAT